MTVNEVLGFLDQWAPLHYAEDFDNVGLLIGDNTQKVTGVLVSLDTLEGVVDEAIEKSCNLIVSFHPIIFKGLQSLTGKNYVERVTMKAIKHDIAIIAIHTALDNAVHGVSAKMAEMLGLTNTKILLPKRNTIKKLVTYVPKKHVDKLQNALFEAGAGNIGNYSDCSFTNDGTGSFKPHDEADPALGKKNERNLVDEVQINMTFQSHQEKRVVRALFDHHPYEQVAYEVHTLANTNQTIGMGMVGHLEKPYAETEFLELLKTTMKTGCIRHSALRNKPIQKVAVLGGSGSFAIQAAKASQADAYVTSDLKYHDFFQAEHQILLVDIGHYESEQYTKNLIAEYLTKKIANFAPALPTGIVHISAINTNPVKYY